MAAHRDYARGRGSGKEKTGVSLRNDCPTYFFSMA